MADTLQVEVVAADRVVWSGGASQVNARTVEGELGILRGHTPVLSVLSDGIVEITPDEGAKVVAAVDGGFLSVANDRISILSEHVLLSDEIDLAQAQAELEAAQSAVGTDDDAEQRVRRAEALVSAAQRAK